MRCDDVRRMLTGSRREPISPDNERDIAEHLRTCRDCAAHAESAELLRRVLTSAKTDDTAEMVSLADQRRTLTERLSKRGPSKRLLASATLGLDLYLPRWRRFALGAAAAIAALMIVTLVPFTYQSTVGYDIAFGGVGRDLALDTDRICDTLLELGLYEAGVEVTDCDSTCGMVIMDLHSQEEICMVVTTINSLDPGRLSTAIIPVIRPVSRSLLHQVNDKLFSSRLTNIQCDTYQ